MPFVPIADTVRIIVKWNDDCHNVFHLTGGVSAPTWPLTPADCEDAISEFTTAFGGTILPLLDDGGTIETISAKDVSVADGDEWVIGSAGAGGVTDGTSPLNVAVCVSWRTGVGGGRGRGRTFLPFIPSSYVGATLLTPLARASLQSAAEDFLTDAAWDKFTPAVASRLDGLSRPIASALVDQEVDTQARRLHG